MNELQIFQNSEFGEIRTIEKDGEPWFVGKDVAEILGYANASKAVSTHVDDEDKTFIMLDIADSQNGNLLVGQSKTTIINESGLYSLVLSSKLPTAKKFKRWVTGEVIPSIRKHGMYATQSTVEQMLADPDTAIRLLSEIKAEREQRKALQKQIEEQKSAVIFTDAVVTSKNSILIGELAKLLKQNGIKMGQNRLFEWMRQNGYLIRRQGSDYNMPTQKSMELGLFKIKETCVTHSDGHTSINRTPKVTGKGQVYLLNKILGRKVEQIELEEKAE